MRVNQTGLLQVIQQATDLRLAHALAYACEAERDELQFSESGRRASQNLRANAQCRASS
jgi:hypothetical protein